MQQNLNSYEQRAKKDFTKLKTIVAKVEYILLHYEDAVNYPSNCVLRFRDLFGNTFCNEEAITRSRRALLFKERRSVSPRFIQDKNARKYAAFAQEKAKEYYKGVQN